VEGFDLIDGLTPHPQDLLLLYALLD